MMSSWLFTHLSVDCTVIGEESKHGGDPFTYSIVIVLAHSGGKRSCNNNLCLE